MTHSLPDTKATIRVSPNRPLSTFGVSRRATFTTPTPLLLPLAHLSYSCSLIDYSRYCVIGLLRNGTTDATAIIELLNKRGARHSEAASRRHSEVHVCLTARDMIARDRYCATLPSTLEPDADRRTAHVMARVLACNSTLRTCALPLAPMMHVAQHTGLADAWTH